MQENKLRWVAQQEYLGYPLHIYQVQLNGNEDEESSRVVFILEYLKHGYFSVFNSILQLERWSGNMMGGHRLYTSPQLLDVELYLKYVFEGTQNEVECERMFYALRALNTKAVTDIGINSRSLIKLLQVVYPIINPADDCKDYAELLRLWYDYAKEVFAKNSVEVIAYKERVTHINEVIN